MRNFYIVFFLFHFIICFGQAKNDSIAIESLLDKAKTEQGKLKYKEAYQTFQEALNLAKKTGNKALEFKTEIAIANMHIMKGEEILAKDFFENKLPDNFFSKELESYYYHRKAFYYDQRLQIDSAFVTAIKGVEIAKEAGLTSDLIILYNELGYISERQKKFSTAEEYYDKVLALTKDDLKTYSNTYLNKGRLYSLIKKYKESNLMLEDNLRQISATDWYTIKVYIHDMISQNYKNLGDSLNYYKHLFHHRDEILNGQVQYSETQYKDLLLKYQTKEKDELLAAKGRESKNLTYLIIGLILLVLLAIPFVIFIRRKNQKLNKLLAKNNFLLSELNHRIKNNLQLIVSLTARETNKTDNSEITGLINLASKIESIASLHKQLYLNDELKSVYLKPYIDEIISAIQPFLQQNGIEIFTEINDVEINSNNSLYVGLIINELLVNSIKHAFTGQNNKQIKIAISTNKKQLEIDYKDNGTGISQGKKVKLINTLSRQIEADYTIENKEGFHYIAKIKI